ncbi:SDR family NAD(P)-dependent oxidoreductase [Maribacter antarcticus]|uniref:SDR family NAD(P)-dependent oxidoreductase n=1 Tax=Maribacter antarcticus TaxID=505250 RepID=UPI00047DB656|nr:SDR family NAD(P)-dependent oxidoreductase [Maribacter antarcticus]
MGRLENKIVLVTGSARGIGKVISQLFHKEGATLPISDMRVKESLSFSESLTDRNEYLHLDVKDENEWRKITAFIIEKYGKLNILIIDGFN